MSGEAINDTPVKYLELGDGRKLAYAEWGEPDGLPLFFFHGLPGCRLQARLVRDFALEMGYRLIAPDRPGFGYSDFQENRNILDWPKDVEALADDLGLGEFGILGVSGGGPYVLACGQYFTERVNLMGIVSGLGPVTVPPLRRSLNPPFRSALFFYQYSPKVVEKAFEKGIEMAQNKPPRLSQHLQKFMSPKDREIFTDSQIVENFEHSFNQSIRQGARGTIWELKILTREWGFHLNDISTPVFLWHGKKDNIVPYQMTEYMDKHLPHSMTEYFPDEGHYSLPIRHAPSFFLKMSQSSSLTKKELASE